MTHSGTLLSLNPQWRLPGLVLILALTASGCLFKDHRKASRASAGIAPPASELEEDIFQVYTARAFEWRGILAVHSWIAWKKADEDSYTVTEATGWRARRGLPVVRTRQDIPDRLWFDSRPDIIYELRGAEATRTIARTLELIDDYPIGADYSIWPGPNSNTYIAYLMRHNEHIRIELPPHAIGKDWLTDGSYLVDSPSGSGYQFSLLGVLGLTMGAGEGVEFNLLALNFGLDFYPFAVKLPLLGRLGWRDKPYPAEPKAEQIARNREE